MAAEALIALSDEPPLALNEPKFADLMNKRPTVAMNSNGTNLMTVVRIWNHAMLRKPARLTIAGIHSPAKAMTIDHAFAWPVFQKTST